MDFFRKRLQLSGFLPIFAAFKLYQGVKMSPYKAAFFMPPSYRVNAIAAPRGVWDNHPEALPGVGLNSA